MDVQEVISIRNELRTLLARLDTLVEDQDAVDSWGIPLTDSWGL